MTSIFLDTNIHLHAKPLDQIPWESFHHTPITIVIPRVTTRELDHHKTNHPKKHLRERARKALQRIEAASEHPQLRNGVTLHLILGPPSIDYATYHLDPAQPDDQLIANIIEHRGAHPDDTIILYTYDVGPRLTAKAHGITAPPLPPEYHLPSVKDETEAENERLKKQLHTLQTAAPQLALTINNEQHTTPTLNKPIQLTDSHILDPLMAPLHNLPRFNPPPAASTTGDGKLVLLDTQFASLGLKEISPEEYQRYEEACRAYESEYVTYLNGWLHTEGLRSRTIALDITLHNTGGKPAEDITMTLRLPTDLTISTRPPTSAPPPKVPVPPRTWEEALTGPLGTGISPYQPDHFTPDPEQSGPRINGNTVTWWIRRLKHGFNRDIDMVYVTLNALHPFTITYSIHAANTVEPVHSAITIRPTLPAD